LLLEPLSGERTVLVHRGASEDLGQGRSIPWSKLKTRWLYLSSLAGDIDLLSRIVLFAKRKKIIIAYNPGGKELRQREKLIGLFAAIQILIVNREEAALITGAPYENEMEIFKRWDAMSPGINVMTDARNGVMVSDGTFLYKAGIYKEKAVVDRTGAGDAFASGFVASLISFPSDVERAIHLGSANATAKVEGMGAKYGLLTRRQFERSRQWKRLEMAKQRLY